MGPPRGLFGVDLIPWMNYPLKISMSQQYIWIRLKVPKVLKMGFLVLTPHGGLKFLGVQGLNCSKPKTYSDYIWDAEFDDDIFGSIRPPV